MAAGKKVLVGVGAIASGAFLGLFVFFALDLLQTDAQSPNPAAASLDFELVETSGRAQLLSPNGEWLTARANDKSPRLLAIRAPGAASTVKVSWRSLEAAVSCGGELWFGDWPGEVVLKHGLVVLSRQGTSVKTKLFGRPDASVTGSKYAVLALPNELLLTVMDEAVIVDLQGEERRFSAGEAIRFSEDNKVTVSSIEPELTAKVTGIEPAPNGQLRLEGLVTKNAVVIAELEDGTTHVSDIASEGEFSLVVPSRPQRVVAFDGSGRSVELTGFKG